MPVIRVIKTKKYSVMSNYHLQDKRLSLKAKGLMSLILSLPEDWKFTVNGLATMSADGRDTVITCLKQLKENGYICLTNERLKDGKFNSVYTVYENPEKAAQSENPTGCRVGFTESENPTVQNTNNKIKRDILNNISPKERNAGHEFEQLWQLYPQKKGKKDALRHYLTAVKKDNVTFEQVKEGIEKYITYIKAYEIEDKYVKHGSAFFCQHAWEDDYTVKETQRKPKETKAEKNSFNDFPQREYDFDDLEKQLFNKLHGGG